MTDKAALIFKKANINLLIIICQIFFAIIIGQQLALITWQLLPEKTPATATRLAQKTVIASSQNKFSAGSLAQLDSLHLFGRPAKTETVKTFAPESAPVSRLAAKITGLVASTSPANSLAIIRVNSSDQTYRVGDTIQGTKARLESIYPDRVILSNGERYESLLMYPDETQKNRVNHTVSGNAARKNTVAQLRTKILQKPNSWSDIVTISPVRKDNELLGYRVNPAQSPEQFALLGLKPNDMAVAINGYDLTNTSEALKIMGQLSSLIDITLTIKRDGQRFEIDLSS